MTGYFRLFTKLNNRERDVVIAFGSRSRHSKKNSTRILQPQRPWGLTTVLADVAAKIAEQADVRKNIRNDRYYFLWKVNHLSRSTRKEHVSL